MSKLVFLYVLKGGGYLKVGISRDLTRRVASMNGGAVPFEVSLVGSALVHQDVALRAEMDVLSRLGRRARGEWVFEDDITVGDIVRTFALCSSLLPASYRYAFMPGASAALSDDLQGLARSASSEARAKAARDVFEVVAMAAREVQEAPADAFRHVSGKLASPSPPKQREKMGPPTFRQWKKALQLKTMRNIADRRAAQTAAE